MPGTGARDDPYGAFGFIVEIDGVTAAGFSEVSGLDMTIETIEYRNGNEASTVRKLPGLVKYANIVLKRGYTENEDLWDWVKATIDGQAQRRSLRITVLDERREPALSYHVVEAWPCRYEGAHLDAQTSAVAIETIEICHEGLSVERG